MLINNSKARTKNIGIIRRIKRRYQLFIITLTAICLLITHAKPAKANIFNIAKNAMACIINTAGSSGVNTSLLQSLPNLIFGSATLILLFYFVVAVYRTVHDFQQGQELTQILIPPLSAVIGVVTILIFQNLLFGSGGC